MSGPVELDARAQSRLVALAREAIAAHLEGRPAASEEEPGLLVPQGAFVSLKLRTTRALRGCIGYVRPERPLALTVVAAAVAAATEDPRFPAVTRDELAGLELEVSVLGAVQLIRPEDVVVGVHGLIVRCGERSGLLLPQVPLAYGWDREAFLDNTCLKAGLPRGAWRSPDCEIEAFTALVIREGPPSS